MIVAVFVALLAWPAVGLAVALAVGRTIKLRDERK